ncbi:electron transport complex subunit RsxC, partial [Vibrio cyclitrophicus]
AKQIETEATTTEPVIEIEADIQSEPVDPKKAAVAAAIARAKAKKAQQAKQIETEATTTEPVIEIEIEIEVEADIQSEPIDPKKAAVAAAIARAKARKAQQEQDKKNNEEKE